MFNMPIKEGLVPLQWKEANIAPVLKKTVENEQEMIVQRVLAGQ